MISVSSYKLFPVSKEFTAAKFIEFVNSMVKVDEGSIINGWFKFSDVSLCTYFFKFTVFGGNKKNQLLRDVDMQIRNLSFMVTEDNLVMCKSEVHYLIPFSEIRRKGPVMMFKTFFHQVCTCDCRGIDNGWDHEPGCNPTFNTKLGLHVLGLKSVSGSFVGLSYPQHESIHVDDDVLTLRFDRDFDEDPVMGRMDEKIWTVGRLKLVKNKSVLFWMVKLFGDKLPFDTLVRASFFREVVEQEEYGDGVWWNVCLFTKRCVHIELMKEGKYVWSEEFNLLRGV